MAQTLLVCISQIATPWPLGPYPLQDADTLHQGIVNHMPPGHLYCQPSIAGVLHQTAVHKNVQDHISGCFFNALVCQTLLSIHQLMLKTSYGVL